VVGLSIIGEGVTAKQGRALVPIRDRDIGANASVFQGTNYLDRAVGRVTCRTPRTQLPAETGPPDHIEERHVLHHVSRRDQHSQDDAGLAAIHEIMVAIAKVHTVIVLAHQHGIWIGQADPQVGGTLIAAALDAAVGFTIVGIPIVMRLLL